jgi:hypothetical protein
MSSHTRRHQSKPVLITVLQPTGQKIAAKRFSIDNDGNIQKYDYDRAKWFRVELVEVSDIYSLSEHLAELESDNTKLIVRGEPLTHIDLSEPVRRRASADLDDDRAPYFCMAARGVPWLCIDIDSLRLPRRRQRQSPRNHRAALQYAIQQLPDCFHDITCHWQFSSQYMVTDHENIRLHLWYWLDRPITDPEAKRWAQHISADYTPIDTSLYQSVQPHYTAAPIFEDGLEDPLDQRSGLLVRSTDEVTVPDIPEPPSVVRSGTTSPVSGGESFEYWLSCVGDHQGGLGLHEPLLKAAWHYVLENGSDIDSEALVAVLRQTVLDTDASQHSPTDIADRASDSHLYGIVNSALQKLQHHEPGGLIHGIAPRYPAPSNLK